MAPIESLIGYWLLFVSIDACILLLNGWEPISVIERAKLADIVISAKTLHTYKDSRETISNTYSATFQLINILKGHDIMADIPTVGDSLYNVSNWGDKAMCYADVETDKSYILFLTVFDQRLSAKYDDLFGAIADYNKEDEDHIILSLGLYSLYYLSVKLLPEKILHKVLSNLLSWELNKRVS